MEQIGSSITGEAKDKILFNVYAQNRSGVKVLINQQKRFEQIAMHQQKPGFYSAQVERLDREPLYKFILEGEEGAYPDPCSHYQPEGVHGFSQVVDHDRYRWSDDQWPGINWPEAIIYELHIGAFSKEGTFRSAGAKLDTLIELGINTIELMPVTQTPGRWNWGYDGTNLFSVNHNYGSPDDFKHFVDTCHSRGLAVLLDMVYNHFGPEGNYLQLYGSYFTAKYDTAWGAAVNYDDAGCVLARQMVLESVRHWIERYHLDGLRLDAVHAIHDQSPRHILSEIAETARELSTTLKKKIVIIAETDENNPRVINPAAEGGFGIDAQWMDDFHHTVHTILTGEGNGYYQDYGDFRGLEKVFGNYLYTGEYSKFWKKERGFDGSANPGRQFVVALQTHDQVGNRAYGERLSSLISFPSLKAAAGLLFAAPYIPLLFMGEEYGEENPFLFFTDFTDPQIKQAVSEGRKKEFAGFGWVDPPDPENDDSFYRSGLTPREKWTPRQQQIFAYYRDLISLRREHPALRQPDKKTLKIKADPQRRLVRIVRRGGGRTVIAYVNLGEKEAPLLPDSIAVIFDSEAPQYGGRGDGKTKAPGTLWPGQFVLAEPKGLPE
jgi:maltooligosyltrehalose trehalohydrolase